VKKDRDRDRRDKELTERGGMKRNRDGGRRDEEEDRRGQEGSTGSGTRCMNKNKDRWD
jgi:hypothetical protein